MSHGKLRAEKDCLNCGHYVEEKFCPNCGQENSEPRKPFHYLFTHFFEDLTHYDGQFWGTIKNLLFKPGKLTTTYLQGKRQIFVPPVKLYIFVSFVTFLIPSLLPKDHDEIDKADNGKTEIVTDKSKTENIASEDITTIKKLENLGIISDENSKKAIKEIMSEKLEDENNLNDTSGNSISIGTKSLEEYDKQIAKDNSFIDKLFRPFAVKFFELKEQGMTNQQFQEKFYDTLIHSLPKALFLYLPIFAFILWLFHNKTKWWYFDHGVFTLHYFSFLLICTLVVNLLNYIFGMFDNLVVNILHAFIILTILIYSMVYFLSLITKYIKQEKESLYLKEY